MKCFLDMDGVIADFVGAIHKAHGREYCYADPSVRGQFEINPIWGISASEFWSKDSFEFWADIEPTTEASEIVSVLEEAFTTENVCLLTSPSLGVGSISGKRSWVAQHFPQFSNRMIFTSAKQFLAGPERLLVDDRDQNVADFRRHGGRAILVPRHWNSMHAQSDFVGQYISAGVWGVQHNAEERLA